jgi:hypothetical protein
MTDGQSASLSWCKAPIWGPRQDFCYCHPVAGLLTWGPLSDERMGRSFTTAGGPRQGSHSGVRVARDSWPYFTVSRFETPPTWRARSPYLYLRGTEWHRFAPRNWVPYPSPPMIRRATVEVFEPASTRALHVKLT